MGNSAIQSIQGHPTAFTPKQATAMLGVDPDGAYERLEAALNSGIPANVDPWTPKARTAFLIETNQLDSSTDGSSYASHEYQQLFANSASPQTGKRYAYAKNPFKALVNSDFNPAKWIAYGLLVVIMKSKNSM